MNLSALQQIPMMWIFVGTLAVWAVALHIRNSGHPAALMVWWMLGRFAAGILIGLGAWAGFAVIGTKIVCQ